MSSGTPPRLMLYCHDTYGLGHFRRTLTLATFLAAQTPSLSQLIVTGSPVPHNFRLPERVDYIKLPSVVKVGAAQYAPRAIKAPFEDVLNLRRDIITAAARNFRPHALVVDHAPAGLKGEIVPTLRFLRESFSRTKLVLGLRDILDEASEVRAAWGQDGTYELLEDIYDLILVYGQRDVFDPTSEYELSSAVAAKTRFVGYLVRPPNTRTAEEVRRSLCLRTGRLALVMAGGGGDGHDLLRAMLDALRLEPKPVAFDSLLISGPLMPDAVRDDLQLMANGSRQVQFLSFTDDVPSYLGAADVVVSMGGYNSVCEILSASRPAIIVPRVTPRREQLMRAAALSRRGLLRMIHPAELSPQRLLQEINDLLSGGGNGAIRPLAMDGLPRAAVELGALLGLRGPSAQRPAGNGPAEPVDLFMPPAPAVG